MKRKKAHIHKMCLMYRPDYNLRKKDNDPPWVAGMTKFEAEMLYLTMEKLYNEHFKPLSNSKKYKGVFDK